MKKIISILLMVSIVFSLTSCSTDEELVSSSNNNSAGVAYIYGEQHGVPVILEKEFELWHNYYHENSMRHLFVELPFYGAEYLNLWMNSDTDAILDEMFADIKGTAMDTEETKDFYKNIKKECPETIFHGIDVGHAYDSMGNRYLNYLLENGLEDTQAFDITKVTIEQGEEFYATGDNDYRENMLVENFKREFNSLGDKNVMGIFGSSHTDLNSYITENTANMVTQLTNEYGDNIIAESLTYLAKDIESIKVDVMLINGNEYEGEYFGKQDLSSFLPEFSHREFWKLTDAFEDFSNNQTTGNVLPLDNFPMNLELNQIYIVDYTKTDGSVTREVHRYEGAQWNGQEVTEQIALE